MAPHLAQVAHYMGALRPLVSHLRGCRIQLTHSEPARKRALCSASQKQPDQYGGNMSSARHVQNPAPRTTVCYGGGTPSSTYRHTEAHTQTGKPVRARLCVCPTKSANLVRATRMYCCRRVLCWYTCGDTRSDASRFRLQL